VGVPHSFQTLLRDPDPGLVFSANDAAGVGRRSYSTPHTVAPRAGWLARRALKALVGSGGDALQDLRDFFEAHDGLSLCMCKDPAHPGGIRAALSFLPVSAWDAATATAEFNDDGHLFAGLEDIYRRGRFKIIASSPNEGTLLTVLLEDGYDAQAKAGAIYYLSLRPACERLFPFAPRLNVLLERLAANPAGFLHALGFTGRVKGLDGMTHPDLIETYVADVRARADFVEDAGVAIPQSQALPS
jgi:hypothetical protein